VEKQCKIQQKMAMQEGLILYGHFLIFVESCAEKQSRGQFVDRMKKSRKPAC